MQIQEKTINYAGSKTLPASIKEKGDTLLRPCRESSLDAAVSS